MERNAAGAWTVALDLENGTYLYNFVEDTERWIVDPVNVQRRSEDRGIDHAIFWLGPDSMLDPTRGVLGDGVVLGAGLRHDPTNWRDRQRLPDGGIRLVTYSLRGDVESASVAFSDGSTINMVAIDGSDILDAWQADVPANSDGLQYTFLFQDGGRFVRHPQLHDLDTDTSDLSKPRTPDWAKNAIWYQLMVERFRDGSDANDPAKMRPWTSEWYSPSPWEGEDGSTFTIHSSLNDITAATFRAYERSFRTSRNSGSMRSTSTQSFRQRLTINTTRPTTAISTSTLVPVMVTLIEPRPKRTLVIPRPGPGRRVTKFFLTR